MQSTATTCGTTLPSLLKRSLNPRRHLPCAGAVGHFKLQIPCRPSSHPRLSSTESAQAALAARPYNRGGQCLSSPGMCGNGSRPLSLEDKTMKIHEYQAKELLAAAGAS